MSSLNPYLTFNGNCREAMTFYHQAIGGELNLQTFGDSPGEYSEEKKNQIMHSTLIAPGINLMASDNMDGFPFIAGNNITLNIDCDNTSQQDTIWNGLSAGGTVGMPLQETFWGARFGMFTDKFGVNWMLNCQIAAQPA